MSELKQREAIKDFVEFWKDKGYEKGESQKFWLHLLTVLGVEHPEQFITFEDQVKLDHTSFIDGYIETTHVMIEQKSSKIDLYQAIKQSDESTLNPFQQAQRYSASLPYSKRPRWIVTCNFQKFCVYDMERLNGEPQEILLKDLEKDYYRLGFLTDTGNENLKKEMEISIKAGEIVGVFYDALLKQYYDKTNEETLKSLNKLCVRLVFCLYAEDAGVFPKRNQFLDYMKQYEAKHFRKALIDLFKVLDTKYEDRDPYLEDDLKAFPYVNGGLFADEDIEIPQFTEEIIELILTKASADFDWSDISPTIFGAVFESTLNPETRRSGGMHYTSIENIHKVIDPLFMDELNNEFAEIKARQNLSSRTKKLKEFQEKLANLTFLDPACGSGNFLTETYISLRKLENEILYELQKGQIKIGLFDNPIRVSIQQFYGIEINDFAVTVAKTALWIAESQMMKMTENIVHMDLDFLPLKNNANIVEANALRIDWETVVPKDKLNYIMGNPPFVGFTYMTNSQKFDMGAIFPNVKNLDFVCAWYKKANDFIQNTTIKVAFVSTNSISQGETVGRFWGFLNVYINFAYQTFKWDSEANSKAHVHCIIIGFSCIDIKTKYLFINGQKLEVNNINAYLKNAPNIIITSKNNPICDVPKMVYGNKPADGGHLIIEENDYENFVKDDPHSLKYIKKLLGATEFINNKKRWCIWLNDVSPKDIKECPKIMERVNLCKISRENSIASAIRKFALTPTLFAQITQPKNKDYIIIPRVSSEKRKYIPIGFETSDTIVTDAVQIVPNANLYHFGILTSNVHMAWMRTVCGRLKSDYRYSKDIVYNNFPWCEPTDEQKAKIEKTAQGILDARAKYPECSLADLYDELTMPPELRKAHQKNDKAVMIAYGFYHKDTKKLFTESETVAELMNMYQRLTK